MTEAQRVVASKIRGNIISLECRFELRCVEAVEAKLLDLLRRLRVSSLGCSLFVYLS
jgi:hypothetical protein